MTQDLGEYVKGCLMKLDVTPLSAVQSGWVCQCHGTEIVESTVNANAFEYYLIYRG